MNVLKQQGLKITIMIGLIFALIIQPIMPGIEAFAATMGDSIPPEIESIEVSQQIVSVGDTLKIRAHLTDNQSGVEYAYVVYKSPSGNRVEGIRLNYNPTEEVWEGNYTIQSTDEEGIWSISWIDLRDKAGNYETVRQYSDALLPFKSRTDFTIANENGDSTPPEITSIDVSPKEAKPGDNITIKAYLKDDRSGVEYAYVVYKSPSGNRVEGIRLNYNSTEEVWEGTYTIQSTDEEGIWSISWIDLRDKAGNYETVRQNSDALLPFKSQTDITIANENGDSSPPEITNIDVSPKEAQPGDKITVKAHLKDDRSGVEYAYVVYKSPSGNRVEGIRLNYNFNEGVWEGNYPINSTDEAGVWSISWIDLRDKAGNYETVRQNSGALLPFKSQTDFKITHETEDTTPPEIPTVDEVTDQSSAITGSAEPGATVSVKAETEELSSTEAAEDGTFTITIPMQKAGTILSITATDKAGNSSEPKSVTVKDVTKPQAPIVNGITDTSSTLTGTAEAGSTVSVQAGTGEIGSAVVGEDGYFTVYIPIQLTGTELTVEVKDAAGNTSDPTAIVVTEDENTVVESISIDKQQVTIGETVQVSVKMKDYTGIDYLNAYYHSPVTSQNYTVRLDLNPLTGSYEGYFPINSYLETGTYELTMLSTYGVLGIHSIQKYEDPLQFENGDIVVTGTSGINVIESITLDKKEVAAGETLGIKVKTSQKLDVHTMILYYDTPITNKSHNVTVVYNAETDVYEGIVSVQSNFDSGIYQLDMLSMYGPGVTTALYNWQYGSLFDTGDFTVSGTSGKDVIESIKVINKEVTAGDTMHVSVDVTDPTGLSYMNLYYESPDNGKNFTVGLHYNPESNAFEGSMPVELHKEETNYNVYMISLYYTFNNTTALYDSYYGDLFNSGDFKVYTEENPPTFKSLTIDKKMAESGDKIGITVEAADDTHLQEAVVHYTSPVSETKHSIVLNYYATSGKFFGEFLVDESTEIGNWLIDTIEIKDTNQNATILHNGESDLNSGTFTINKKDVIAPDTPTVDEVTDKSIAVTGKAEAGSTVYVKVGTDEIGSTTAEEDGTFNINIPVQKAGTKLSVTATDKAGNKSEVLEITVKDVTNPEKPIVQEVTDKSTEVKGTAESGSTITVVSGTENLATTVVKEDGTFEVAIPVQKAGTMLTVTATDKAGNKSESQEIIVKDVTNPDQPSVQEVTDKSTLVKGTAESGSTITVESGTEILATTVVKDDSSFEVAIPVQKAGTKLIIAATDQAGNKSEAQEIAVKDVTNPEKPVVHEVTDQSTSITGKAEAGSTVSVRVGSDEIGSTTAKEDGTFNITIPVQKAGTKLVTSVTDQAGNKSEAQEITVKDVTFPEKPVVNEVTDKSTVLAGTAEPGSTITIKAGTQELATTVVKEDGTFEVAIPVQKAGSKLSITVTDQSGNKSEAQEIMVKDVTNPEKPVVQEVTDKTTGIKGTAEAGSTLSVKAGSEEIGSAVAKEDETFTISIPVQSSNTKLTITATDTAGNPSEVLEITVKDTTPPQLTSVNEVTSESTIITGTAEPGAIVSVHHESELLGSAYAAEDGSFEVSIPQQNADTKLLVRAADLIGNESEIYEIVVKNATPPVKPQYFTDIKGHWAENEMIKLSELGLVKGYTDGSFGVSKKITRAEVASIIARHLKLEGTPSTFTDIPSNYWASNVIGAIQANKIMSGYNDGTFKPNAPITRAEIASIMERAYNLKGEGTLGFTDVPSTHWAYKPISVLVFNNLTSGFSDNTFRPNAELSRAEFAAFLSRVIN
ncbi:Ig-like domain-containing protein [Fictibacillus sp. BK138]|uniref:Ig-like domain-containing protein n=1 Tax=Fictibacillus sp. BK138 TaxID=2512121 RepID=UPI001029513E|nr:Ig-like domain-containing protein [Fictibacillus sp. BK138]RZT21363.1 Ig-like protein group 3 [Fictibacillus sp. BK138]